MLSSIYQLSSISATEEGKLGCLESVPFQTVIIGRAGFLLVPDKIRKFIYICLLFHA